MKTLSVSMSIKIDEEIKYAGEINLSPFLGRLGRIPYDRLESNCRGLGETALRTLRNKHPESIDDIPYSL